MTVTLQPLMSPPLIVLFTATGILLAALGYRRVRHGAFRARSGSSPLWDLVRRTAMVIVLACALMGPAVPVEQEAVVSNVEIVFAVDRTGSMAAEDGPDGAPRMDAVRQDIRTLVQASASARFAVVTWDSSSRIELPVTTDASAVMSFAEGLHQEISEFSTGSTLARPAQTVRGLLESSVEERPENQRFLVVMSDGESTDGSMNEAGEGGLEAWAGISDLIDGGVVIGYGTPEGGPMRIYGVGGVGATEEYMTDEDGQKVLSRIDEASLADLATIVDVPLLLNPTQAQVSELGTVFLADAGVVLEDRRVTYTYAYVTWIPALALAALVAWEIVVVVSRALTLRRTHAI